MSKALLIERVGSYAADVIIFDIRSKPNSEKWRYKMETYLKGRYAKYSLCGGETRELMDEVHNESKR